MKRLRDGRFIVEINGVPVPMYSRGAAVIEFITLLCRLAKWLWRLACTACRSFSKKESPMFGSYTPTPKGPHLVFSNERYIRPGRSRARLQVIEGDKGKPLPQPRLLLPAPAPQSNSPTATTDTCGPQPRIQLPERLPPEQWW